MKNAFGPYGSFEYLPSGIICTPVPKGMTPASLVARMPNADVAAKVGSDKMQGKRNVRVVRRNAV